jgi:hypothetical protein
MLRTVNHAKEIERAFSGKPCADVGLIALTSVPWWWTVRVEPAVDDRVEFLNSLYALPDIRA